MLFRSGEVRLGLKLAEEGEVTLDFQNMTGFNHDVFLIDNELKGAGREIDLRKNPAYTFQDKKGVLDNRFKLRFSYNPMGNGNIENEYALQISQSEDHLHIRSLSGPASSLQVYTVSGVLVYNSTAMSDRFSVNVQKQRMYIVKAVIDGKEIIQKVVKK